MNISSIVNTSHLVVFKQGFKVSTTPSSVDGIAITSLFDLPYDVFILDLEGKTVKINQAGAEICGFETPEHAIGHTVAHGGACETATVLLDNCQQVLNSEAAQFYDEVLRLANQTTYHLFSIKKPFYDENEVLIGSIGVSIVIGKHAMATALNVLTELGFLPASTESREKAEIEPNLGGVELTAREHETLMWMIKGYSAKMIARELSISHRTVEDYQRQLKQKFKVTTRQSLLQKVL